MLGYELFFLPCFPECFNVLTKHPCPKESFFSSLPLLCWDGFAQMFSCSGCDTGGSWAVVIVCSFVTRVLKLLSVSVLGVSSPVNTQAQWAEHEVCFINFYGFMFCRHGGDYSCFSGCKSYKAMHAQNHINFWWYGLLFFNIIEHILLYYILPLQIYFRKNVLINFLQLSSRYNERVVARQWTGYRILRGLLLFKLKTWGHSAE